MWSKYLRTRERDEMVAVFHELQPRPVFVTCADWNTYTEGVIQHSGLETELRERGLVIDSLADDEVPLWHLVAPEFCCSLERLLPDLEPAHQN